MKKKKQKTKDETSLSLDKGETKPENFKTQEAAEEAAEEYIKSQPIYNYFQFFIGTTKLDKNKQQGKPGSPPY